MESQKHPSTHLLQSIASPSVVALINDMIYCNPVTIIKTLTKQSSSFSILSNSHFSGVDAHIALEFHEARGKCENCVIKIAENSITDNLISLILPFSSSTYMCACM